MSQEPGQDLLDQLDEETKQFYQFHGVQLIGINFPPKAELIKKLYIKLKNQMFDAGTCFQILDNEARDTYQVVTQQDMIAQDDVFLIDHAFSFRYTELRKNIEGNPNLQARLKNILKYADKKREHHSYPKSKKTYEGLKEYDEQEIEDPNDVEIPAEATVISFWGNKISEVNALEAFLEKRPNLKGMWLNDNPVSDNSEALFDLIETKFPHIEMLNSKLTKNAGEWGLKFANTSPNLHKMEKITIETLKSLDLSGRDAFRIKDIEVFAKMKELRTLNLKEHALQDLTETNKLMAIFQKTPQLEHVLVDEQLSDILWSLHQNKKLENVAANLKSINGYYLNHGQPKPEEQDLKFILDNIWKLVGSYRLASEQQLDETSIWYLMDEFGSSIEHSDEPNAEVSPFLFAPNNKLDAHTISYNVMWVTKNINAEESIYRDYLNHIDEGKFRKARLAAWFDLPKKPFITENTHKLGEYKQLQKPESEISSTIEKNTNENISQLEANKQKGKELSPWTVATDSPQVSSYLTDKNFQITTNIDEAKILWVNANLKEDIEKYLDRYINQIPYEACLVMKNNLARTLYKAYGLTNLIKMTYNLDKELNAFVGQYLSNQKSGQPNYWIIKPPNMARSMDMVVTNNLDLIIRNLETGPKLAQKYIENPMTFRKKKIDFRFDVLVRSMDPLDILIYKPFLVRPSIKDFTMDPRTLMDYETHFTVMNYVDPSKITNLTHKQFIDEFDQAHKSQGISWDVVYEKVKQAAREVFIAAKLVHPEMKGEKAKAIYGMDLMFDEEFNPYILELTFQPDNTRFCKTNPNTYNDIFRTLYLYEDEDTNVDRLF